MNIELLTGAVAALAGAIGWLYRDQKKMVERIELKLDECEKDRKDLWAKVATMEKCSL